MKSKITALAMACSIFSVALSAQTVESATLDINNVKAVVNANGYLFRQGINGQFIAPYDPGQPELSTMRAAGIWLSGLDPGGNLKGAVHLYHENGNTDFQPGTLNPANGEPDGLLTGIYRVTDADIAAHLSDFADNGVIDNPNPNVFGWPATGNLHFPDYHNGDLLPNSFQGLAPFWDNDGNSSYTPENGDFPILDIRGCNDFPLYPDEMLWFVFNDNLDQPHSESGMAPMGMEIQCLVFAFDCQESPLGNTVFTKYKLINRANEAIDSTYFGVFADFDIGNPGDDFFGSDADRSLIFGYNGDNDDEGGYGSGAPAMAVDLLRGPLNQFAEELPLSHVMPIDQIPQNPVEFYRLLSGSLPDGTPGENGGFYYDGNPNVPGEWSEVGEGNTPGDRRVLGSYGPFLLQPGAINELIMGFSFYQEPDNTALGNLEVMYSQADQVQLLFDNCFDFSVALPCTANPTAVFEAAAEPLEIYPNPATDFLTVELPEAGLEQLSLMTLEGKIILTEKTGAGQKQAQLDLANIPAGIYFILGQMPDGKVARGKLVVLNN